ncbi:hypothetical protein E2C01_096643 [Portunus trituberculatus]|uniref:Uncharacterized protein n=1 Tax=Portunus trituberculatus TaxID=210409 RepID=A0A5B7K7S0_PORTR|nr:hypothetical protein [Portunus trituberculatus]
MAVSAFLQVLTSITVGRQAVACFRFGGGEVAPTIPTAKPPRRHARQARAATGHAQWLNMDREAQGMRPVMWSADLAARQGSVTASVRPSPVF